MKIEGFMIPEVLKCDAIKVGNILWFDHFILLRMIGPC
jgi:hypothetical protein